LDGTFDAGKPQMWTVVAANTNDANYNLRRFFIDESMGESNTITVILQPNIAGVSNVELFSNLNRRDFAVLPGDEDPATVTTTSPSTYYRAYPMTNIGGGQYSVTVPVNRCGVYRLNARYTVAGKTYYYTDNGLRRDCSVVVSPTKALNLRMYELNPMIAEATNDTFYGRSTLSDMYSINTDRPDTINTNYFKNLGVNMIWLQPIHPIGSDNRQTDPATGGPFDPGSPYAVKNYWQVNNVLGNPATTSQAMTEFQNFVAAMQKVGVGTMLDGTFNHSAWDCEVGDVAQQMFPSWATSPTGYIRDLRPQWYSKSGDYSQHASFYLNSSTTDIAVAPDRNDFGKWSDVADFNFGKYDTLVTTQSDDQKDNFLSERDVLQPLDAYHRELWQYFANYTLYWLGKTGCPAGTPKSVQPTVGIAGLRCDFAQGLPSQFWEYTINKTRATKWDFVFMAESLDGYRTVNGSNRHGLSFRSARQFDVLNENMIFYWRDQFFSYFNYPAANSTTAPTFTAFESRRNAYDLCPILLNLTGHDELLPHDQQWRILYGYAILGAMDGVPLLFNGQEAGLQNDAATYSNRSISAANNFARYESNFGKSIPNFKRYNQAAGVWNGLFSSWKTPLVNAYQRINTARANSIALRGQQNYFLNKQVGGGYDADIFAVAKLILPGIPVASQDVVFAFVNNNYAASSNRLQTYSLNVTAPNGQNYFGITASHNYNIVDLMSTNPTTQIWSPDKTGTELINNGIFVGLNGNNFAGQQAQYLRLIDKSVPAVNYNAAGIPDPLNPDKDGDGLPDAWETANSLNPNSATGDNGADGDKDRDGMTNLQEYLAGTNPNDPNSVLKITNIAYQNGNVDVDWTSVPGKNYAVEASTNLVGGTWQQIFFGTAFTSTDGITEQGVTNTPQRFYRARVLP
ncbi:MAG: alpha-amylase family glycosyl hydrolase, partial [Verrucomicrobiota bacterium]